MMWEQIIIRISLRDDAPLRWPCCEDCSAPSPLPSKQRVAGSNPAGRAGQGSFGAVGGVVGSQKGSHWEYGGSYDARCFGQASRADRKSTRLNSSHLVISY